MVPDLQTFTPWVSDSDAYGVLFSIPGLTKTRRSGPPKEAFYRSFSEDLRLCQVENLKVYEEKTASLRKMENDKEALLFISYRKPHNPVTSSSIARWLKEFLNQAGVNTTLFKVHTTQAASTSTAKMAGLSTKTL